MRINPKLKEDLKKYLSDKMKKNRQKVIVMSSEKLSQEDKNLIKSKLKNVDFDNADYTIDESLIAGVKITVGSQVIDLSLKGSLSNLKNIIYESD